MTATDIFSAAGATRRHLHIDGGTIAAAATAMILLLGVLALALEAPVPQEGALEWHGNVATRGAAH